MSLLEIKSVSVIVIRKPAHSQSIFSIDFLTTFLLKIAKEKSERFVFSINFNTTAFICSMRQEEKVYFKAFVTKCKVSPWNAILLLDNANVC